jgi:adenosylmethionine-8-amino-7-oxononanoate aminotransferase
MVSPPLIVTEAQIDEIAGLIETALDAYAAELRAAGVRLG